MAFVRGSEGKWGRANNGTESKGWGVVGPESEGTRGGTPSVGIYAQSAVKYVSCNLESQEDVIVETPTAIFKGNAEELWHK